MKDNLLLIVFSFSFLYANGRLSQKGGNLKEGNFFRKFDGA